MSTTLPHRRGIDGLRAFAVTAVLLYHAGVTWIPGGFLGVDVFFAISGYLITSLLVAELVATGEISLHAFWARRARRLLPAVAVLLLGVSTVALVLAPDAASRLRGDLLAALTYSSNWWQIIRGESYFETFGRPPLLRHLWSLAVEEQLYIVLPLTLAWFGRRGSLPRPRMLAGCAVAGAAGSAILLQVLWRTDDPSRAWFGTDTRAAGLLVGVALGLVWPVGGTFWKLSRARRRAVDAAALLAIGGLMTLMLTIGERDAGLHRFGFALTAVLAGVAVATVAHPASRVGRVLGIRPLHWIGTRSYAIYLWHWPVIALTRPHLDVDIDGWQLLAVRMLITLVLAEASWRLVEQPFRTGTVKRAWHELRQGVRVRIAIAGVATISVLAVALGAGLTSAGAPARPDLLATVSVGPTTPTTLARIPSTTTTASSTTTSTTTGPVAAPTTTAPPAPPTTMPPLPQGAVLAVGDSVMLAARDALVSASGGRVYVDAVIGRQVDAGLEVLQHYRDAGTFTQISALVIHLGTNGPMNAAQFERLAVIVDGVPRVVVLNVRVPKSWEGESNASINGGVGQHPAMRLGDWYSASAEPGAIGDDGVHPSRSGARIYSNVVLQQVADAPPPPPPETTTTTAPPPPETTTTTAPPTTTTTTAEPAPPPTAPTTLP